MSSTVAVAQKRIFAMSAEIWDEVARTIARQSPCPRAQVGAVIFRADRKAVLSTGYNGQARKSDSILCGGSCCDRDRLGIPSGERIEIGCIHAEINAIANAVYEGIALADACIVITAPPCLMCSKMIIQSGIRTVYYRGGQRWTSTGEDYLSAHGISLIRLE